MPQEFPEDPIEAFKRGVYVAPFWEDDFKKMAHAKAYRGKLWLKDDATCWRAYLHTVCSAPAEHFLMKLQNLDHEGAA